MSNKEWNKITWFTPDEFDDPDHPGSGKLINFELVRKLDVLRELVKGPVIIHGGNFNLGGAVDVNGTHGHSKHSYHLAKQGCKAADFHIVSRLGPRMLYGKIALLGFGGIGVYYDWNWVDGDGKKFVLPIGFHVDLRPFSKTQRWTRRNGEYLYLLGRNN